jgi:outer membrane protein assembly factor BamE
MGSPLLIDSFHQDRWDYLYSIQPGGRKRRQEQITLYFSDDKLTHFTGDFVPGAAASLEESDEEQETSEDKPQENDDSWSIRSLWPF